MNLELATRLVGTLPESTPTLFNPWADSCAHDSAENSPAARLERLAAHLACEARVILVGEAPGYQGCRYSGIPFTSERLLLEGAIPRIAALGYRLSTRRLPFSEPSATIIWKALYRFGIQDHSILWNAIQMHPHRSGAVWTNRTPTDDELAAGRPALTVLKEVFPAAAFLAVGKKAAGLLKIGGIQAAAELRHPANGGATEFARGLERALSSTLATR